MSYRLSLLTIFLFGLLLAGGSLWAKEDTAYLTFRKSAPAKPGTTVYTVKKGEWLLDIGRRVTGETKHVYSIIRKYNPGIKNLNLIYPGQKIILPVKSAAAASPPVIPPVTAPPLSQQTGLLKDDLSLPSQTKWSLVKKVLEQIGATVTSQGKYYLPLRDMGQITIDCRKIPMVEFADRGIVFVDFRNQIPDNLRQLVRQTWKHYAIVKADPKSEAAILLEKIISASNTHAMVRLEQPLQIGTQPVLQIPAGWTITRKSSFAASPPHAIALWTMPDGNHGLPEPLASFAESKGWKVVALVGDTIAKPALTDPIPARPVSNIASASLIDIADNCFRRLGLQTQKNAELKIFDSARDGFDLRITADLMVSNGEKRLILIQKKLPDQFLKIISGSGIEVILTVDGETKKSLLEKSARAMNIPCENSTFFFPPRERADREGISVSFPALKITADKMKVMYLIDFDMDERLNGFLADKMGLLVLKY